MRELRNEYELLDDKSEETIPFGIARHREEGNIQINLNEM
jgi:hypothetical protein